MNILYEKLVLYHFDTFSNFALKINKCSHYHILNLYIFKTTLQYENIGISIELPQTDLYKKKKIIATALIIVLV